MINRQPFGGVDPCFTMRFAGVTWGLATFYCPKGPRRSSNGLASSSRNPLAFLGGSGGRLGVPVSLLRREERVPKLGR